MSSSPNNSNIKSQAIRSMQFFELVRRIERTNKIRIGTDLRPANELIALKAEVSPNFAPTEVASWDQSASPQEVSVSFFGVFGPSGALPNHYTHLIVERCRNKDFALRDFLDMFNHRLLSFFYRCWAKSHFPIAYESARTSECEDPYTEALRALVGYRANSLKDRSSIPSDDFIFFSGHFSNVRRTATALKGMLQSIFGVEVEILELLGQELLIPESEQSKIGAPPFGTTLGNQLGVDIIVGKWIVEFENFFRIRVGPLNLEEFRRFQPNSTHSRKVFDFARSYVGPQFDFDLQLVLKANEVPTAQLGNETSARLGWNTWLGNWKSSLDADNVIFQLGT